MAIRTGSGGERYVPSFVKPRQLVNTGAKLHSKTMQTNQVGFWGTEFISHDRTSLLTIRCPDYPDHDMFCFPSVPLANTGTLSQIRTLLYPSTFLKSCNYYH
jgi:hypothetical protein